MTLLLGSTWTTATDVSKDTKFRPDIQGLRALAVIAVVLDHFLGWPSGGFVGVDVFFVISGFLITSLLLREHDKSGTISFTGFYLRRAKRILPAAIAVVGVTVAASALLFSSTRFSSTLWDGVWATLFGANWRFAVTGTDYFQSGGPVSPLQHYWSLAVEEQFYFVWPWLMLLIFWGASRKRTPGDAKTAIGVAIVLLTAASFAWSVWETQANVSWAYFSTFSRAWELGIGATLAVYVTTFSQMSHIVRKALAWVGLTGIVFAVFTMTDTVAFPGPAAALPVLATAMVIAAGTGEARSAIWPLTNPVAQYLGHISYSLYLWHFPVAILFLSFYPGDSAEYYILGALAILGLSVASFHLIEDPIRRFKWAKKRKKRFWVRNFTRDGLRIAGVCALAVITAVTVAAALASTAPSTTAASVPIFEIAAPAAEPTKVKCWGAAALDPSADCDRELGTESLPNPKVVGEDIGNSYDCFPSKGQQMKSCTYGSGAIRVAVIGDSHAASLLPGLSMQAQSHDWTLDTYVGVGCIWTTESCKAMDEIGKKLLERPYDIVITSAYRGSGNTDKVAQASEFAAAWQAVASTGAKIIVVKDVPMSVGPAVQCVQRVNFSVQNNDCGINLRSAFPVEDGAALAAEFFPNAAVVETAKYFCSDTICPAVIGNVLVYRDDIAHISASYSKTLGPYLAKDIAAAAASLVG